MAKEKLLALFVILLIAAVSPVRASGPSPTDPFGQCNHTDKQTCKTNLTMPPTWPDDQLMTVKRCVLANVRPGEPHIQTDPVLGIIEVDPSRCIRNIIWL